MTGYDFTADDREYGKELQKRLAKKHDERADDVLAEAQERADNERAIANAIRNADQDYVRYLVQFVREYGLDGVPWPMTPAQFEAHFDMVANLIDRIRADEADADTK
jgi:hypothetical protein